MENLITIENGERVPNTFSQEEYAIRLSRLRDLMVEQNLDAVVFTSYQNINYYSDFLFCHFGRFYALVVTHDTATSVSATAMASYRLCRVRATRSVTSLLTEPTMSVTALSPT